MSLREYRRKRDFHKTREPAPGSGPARGKRPIFVVQLHHARARHYDFRLQVGDALKSWAVPKGPSYDPATKRLAVEVEDHPISYARFEGEIPEGQYGAGHVAIFDHGTWSTDDDPARQLAAGRLTFELHGRKLRGGWHLVRSGLRGAKPQWLLIKANDAYASSIEADDLVATKPSPRRAATKPAAKGTASSKTAPRSRTKSTKAREKTPRRAGAGGRTTEPRVTRAQTSHRRATARLVAPRGSVRKG